MLNNSIIIPCQYFAACYNTVSGFVDYIIFGAGFVSRDRFFCCSFCIVPGIDGLTLEGEGSHDHCHYHY